MGFSIGLKLLQNFKIENRFLKRFSNLAANSPQTLCTCLTWLVAKTLKQCHVGADPVGTFSKITESEFYHTATRIGANEGSDFVKTLG